MVVGHLGTKIGVALHKTTYACRHIVGFKNGSNDVLASNGAHWRLFARLPNAHIAANPSQHAVPAPHRHGKIEGADDANNAERMPLLVHAVQWPLAVHGKAMQLTAKAYRKITDVNHFLHFAQTLLQAFAHFVAYQLAKVLLLQAQGFPYLTHHLAPLGCGPLAPHLKGFLGLCYNLLVTSGVGCRGGGYQAAINRRKALNGRPGTVEPLASNGGTCILVADAKGGKNMIHTAQYF
jgi:hypothetical protein